MTIPATRTPHDNSNEDETTPWVRLLCAVYLRAMRDAQAGCDEAEAFLWQTVGMDARRMDPNAVRGSVQTW